MPYRATGEIEWRVQKDRHDNDVSLIRVGCDWHFRMVHHTPLRLARQRATIYAKDRTFVRVEIVSPDNDCIPTKITIAEYTMEWGDGDPLCAENNPSGPDLKSALEQITEDDFDLVILTVLANVLGRRDGVWESKTPTEPQGVL